MFEAFDLVSSPAAPLRAPNIDTDVIIRIERLTGGEMDKLGQYALEALRYDAEGKENPDFPMNRPKWRHAKILLAGANFGCGSSREPAVTALMAMGLRCVIAESFGDIFYANCFQNGMLPIRLAGEEVARLMDEAECEDGIFTVDLRSCTILTPTGRSVEFDLDAQRRSALLAGLDDIGLSFLQADAIASWQERDRTARPWIWTIHDKDAA